MSDYKASQENRKLMEFVGWSESDIDRLSFLREKRQMFIEKRAELGDASLFRDQIAAYDEEIAELKKKHGEFE